MFSFIETQLFTRLVKQYLSDEQYRAAAGPDQQSGIWASHRRNWRGPKDALGGSESGQTRRVSGHLYYVRRPKGVIWMLTMYPKNVADSIPAHVLREIREEIGDE